MKKCVLALVVASSLMAGGCATGDAFRARHGGAHLEAYVTSADGAQRLSPIALSAIPTGSAPTVITVDPSRRYQTVVGYGASLTDASAILIQGLPEDRRRALIAELFGHGETGLGLDFVRLTIGASDFSPTHYSFNDMPSGSEDRTLSRFSIDPNRRDVLPVIRAALAANPQLTVMASPWSPPGWMKTSGSMIGGTLREDAYGVYAEYFLRYLRAYAAEGVPIRYLTIQNEPDYSPENYPGMKWPAVDRARFIGSHLGPLLERERVATRILDWDHNWDQPEQPLTVLADPVASRFVAGTAWHCYGGDVSAQSVVHNRFPDRETFFTECSGGEWRPGWATGLADAVKLLINSSRGWSRGVLLWNLALDPNRGPRLGGCDTCRGVIRIDPATGNIERELDYYALGHLSRFVRPGAHRIWSDDVGDIISVAFANDDGSIAVLMFNGGDIERSLMVRLPSQTTYVSLTPGAALTVLWGD